MFLGGLHSVRLSDMPEPQPRAEVPAGVSMQLRELTAQVQRLQLLNQAFWELIRDRLNLTDADFERVAHEVDMRDGVADGKMTQTGLQCPNCGRISSSKHWRCLYCGQEFKKPVMG